MSEARQHWGPDKTGSRWGLLGDESHQGQRGHPRRISWHRAARLSVQSVPPWELRWRSDWCLCKNFYPKATMIATFFPLKKLRRNTRYLLFLAILLAGLAAVYHEMVASRAWSGDTGKLEPLHSTSVWSSKLLSKSCITWSGKLEHIVQIVLLTTNTICVWFGDSQAN